jgi:hypothetical protein
MSGVPLARRAAYQSALSNPAVVRLANALQIDLQNEAQASVVVTLADRIHASRSLGSFSAALAKHPYSDADGQTSQLTAVYVTRALITYREMESM